MNATEFFTQLEGGLNPHSDLPFQHQTEYDVRALIRLWDETRRDLHAFGNAFVAYSLHDRRRIDPTTVRLDRGRAHLTWEDLPGAGLPLTDRVYFLHLTLIPD